MATDPKIFLLQINAQIEEFKEQVESYKSILIKESTRNTGKKKITNKKELEFREKYGRKSTLD